MTTPHTTLIALPSGSPSEQSAALSRAASAVETEISRRYPSADGWAIEKPDESNVARQLGQMFRDVRVVRRGKLGVHVALVAADSSGVKVVTQQTAALGTAAIYGIMGAGTLGGAALAATVADGSVRAFVVLGFFGLCAGGGAALGLDRVLQPKLSPEMLPGLHAELCAAVERALRG